MKGLLRLCVVFVMLAFHVAYARNVCTKAPVMSLMLKVLKPMSKVLMDCAGDVIMSHRLNSSVLIKIVQVVCAYHEECYGGLTDIKDRKTKKGIAGECFLRKFRNHYPSGDSLVATEGLWTVKEIMACFCSDQELQLEDSDMTNAVMHWIYEILRPGR